MSTDDEFEALLRDAVRMPPVDPSLGADRLVGRTLVDGRFEVRRLVGSGGMGVVYEAFDRELGCTVALKTLHRLDASGIYRLKSEFRAVRDVAHPNLVRLRDLHADDSLWFFTMDFVAGSPFDRFIRGPGGARAVSIEALRRTLAQVVDGVRAIHDAGKVHRDLKPSNVLVGDAGRVVVLDFGLASEQRARGAGRTVSGDDTSGTPAYMAPEQAAGRTPSPASDAYALGVMLFEALTDRLPFEGRSHDVLAAKQRRQAAPVRSLAAAAPEDLASLCDRLLRRDAASRPTLSEVRAALEDAAGGASAGRRPQAPTHAAFVGRERELAVLDDALHRTRDGRPVAAFVHGDSGIGKSALLARFGELARGRGAVVLSGRCHEREAVPYKAFDGAIDALSRHLRALPDDEAAALLPRDAQLLVQTFPVLGRVDGIARAPRRELDLKDAHQRRRRAFDALGELLGRMGDRQPLVVMIDDLQWTDLDSVRLAMGILAAPEPPALLLLASHRADAHGSQALRGLLEDVRRTATSVEELALGPLGDADLRALWRALAGGEGTTGDLERLERDTRGNPFLLSELARARQRAESPEGTGLPGVLRARARGLSKEAWELFELLCASATPLPRSVLRRARPTPPGAGDPLRELVEEQLAGSVASDAGERYEPYHERLREAALGLLEPGRVQALRLGVARAVEDEPGVDAATRFAHWLLAGDAARAARHARHAAERARGDLAFARAAELYAQALALGNPVGEARQELLVALGDAWSHAGFGRRSADAFLEAGEVAADADSRSRLRWRAAEQLVLSGRGDQAAPLLSELLPEIGLEWPEEPLDRAPPRGDASALLDPKVWKALPLRSPDALDAEELRRIDVCAMISQGLSLGRHHRFALSFAQQAVMRGLGCGEPGRMALALSMAARAGGVLETGKPLSAALAAELEAHLEGLAARCTDPRVRPLIPTWIGSHLALLSMRYRQAVEAADRMVEAVQALPTGSYRVMTPQAGRAWALLGLGRLRELSALANRMLELGPAREHRMALLTGHTYGAHARLARGEPDAARELSVGAGLPDFGRAGWGALALEVATRADLYEDRIESAWARMRDPLDAQPTAVYRVQARWARAGCALAALAAGHDTERARAVAEQHVEELRDEWLAPAHAFAALIEAGLAWQRGDDAASVQRLQDAIEVLERHECAAYVAMARRRLGEVLGGERGRSLVAWADRALRLEDVAEPARYTLAWIPGRPRAPARHAPPRRARGR